MGRSRELSCRVRSEWHLKEAPQPGGEEAARICASTRAAGEAARPAAQPSLGSALRCLSGQLVLISMVTSQHCQAAGLLSRAGGLGWRTAGSFSPGPTLFCRPSELPGNAGRSTGFWPLAHKDCYLAQPVFGVWGLSCQCWRECCPRPFRSLRHATARRGSGPKNSCRLPRNPITAWPCPSPSPLGVQPQAEGGRGRGEGVLAQGWSF